MNRSRLNFRLDAQATGSRARAATFRTLHNEVQTPLFMPVGTQATVKAQLPQTLEDAGTQILLVNTYHLLLRPGPDVFRRTGGIHGFMSWKRSVLTDSGGFQIFSLPHSRAMSEEGAVFQSYLDGKTILLSPELSIETQKAIGGDIMMALDQCIASTADEATARAALGVTHRWAARSLAARGDSPQSIFGIVQGALFQELRRESAGCLGEMPFDGFAIGGLAVGESKSEREDVCEFTAQLLPEDKPRYLMGVGTPLDLLEAVHRGVDMFDCIMPTQLAQRGAVFTSRGFLQMRRGVYKFSEEKLDPACACPTCARYSRAYLHHLTKTSETLGWQLLGKHNIHFYHQLMREIRESILADSFLDLYREKRAFLHESDLDNPIRAQKPKRTKLRTLGNYEVHLAWEGFASIRQISSGEIMHSRTPPMEEARKLYIEQSNLAERVRLSADENPRERRAPGRLGCRTRRRGECHGGDPLLRRTGREWSGASAPNRQLRKRSGFAAARVPAQPRFSLSAPQRPGRNSERRSVAIPAVSGLELAASCPGISSKRCPPRRLRRTSSFTTCFPPRLPATSGRGARSARCSKLAPGAPPNFSPTPAQPPTAPRSSPPASTSREDEMPGEKLETTIALTPAACRCLVVLPARVALRSDWLEKWNRSGAKFPGEIQADQYTSFEQAIREHEQFL